jgi:hypothetical protein
MRVMSLPSVLKTLGRDFATALLPPLVIEFAHEIQRVLWPEWEVVDVPLHFLGGFTIAWMTLILWKRWYERKWIPKIPSWLVATTVWGVVALFGIFWEFYEWTFDYFYHTGMQPSVTDTMGDFLMDLLGGLAFIIAFQREFFKATK